MTMRVHNQGLLHEFCGRHAPARPWINAWLAEATDASWRTPQDIKCRYRNVSFVGKLVIFNVKGNDYRMVTIVAYANGIVFVKWIGTHNDYNKINWESARNETNSRKD